MNTMSHVDTRLFVKLSQQSLPNNAFVNICPNNNCKALHTIKDNNCSAKYGCLKSKEIINYNLSDNPNDKIPYLDCPYYKTT